MRMTSALLVVSLVCVAPCIHAQKRPARPPADPEPAPLPAPEPEIPAAPERSGWLWGGSLSIEMGGMTVLGDGLDSIQQAGFGTMGRDSVTALFTLGTSIRLPKVVDFSLMASYLVGGSFVWDDVFGNTGLYTSFYGDSLALQVELRPLFPFLFGFQPFAGVGYSLTNGMVNDNRIGFAGGRGPFVVGGLCVVNSFGVPWFPLRDDGNWFFGLRISVYYRLPFTLGFNLDWDAYAAEYTGWVPLDQLEAYFEGRSFAASSFAVGVGVQLGFTPVKLGRQAG